MCLWKFQRVTSISRKSSLKPISVNHQMPNHSMWGNLVSFQHFARDPILMQSISTRACWKTLPLIASSKISLFSKSLHAWMQPCQPLLPISIGTPSKPSYKIIIYWHWYLLIPKQKNNSVQKWQQWCIPKFLKSSKTLNLYKKTIYKESGCFDSPLISSMMPISMNSSKVFSLIFRQISGTSLKQNQDTGRSCNH